VPRAESIAARQRGDRHAGGLPPQDILRRIGMLYPKLTR
jgi:hypothetical protein